MMDEPISGFAKDLEEKFKELCSMHDRPALYLSEYLYELRNMINIDRSKRCKGSATTIQVSRRKRQCK